MITTQRIVTVMQGRKPQLQWFIFLRDTESLCHLVRNTDRLVFVPLFIRSYTEETRFVVFFMSAFKNTCPLWQHNKPRWVDTQGDSRLDSLHTTLTVIGHWSMGKGISLSFMACQSKLRLELLHRKKQYFNVSGLVNATGRHKGKIRSLTANLNQNGLLL